MRYDVRLELGHAYQPPVANARHIVKVVPPSIGGRQRVIAADVSFDPHPGERLDRLDFFGNRTVSMGMRAPHAKLTVTMTARVSVEATTTTPDTPNLDGLARELAGTLSLAAHAPHHFTGSSPRVALDADITEYGRQSLVSGAMLREILRRLGERIHADFKYDSKSTDVDTAPRVAFDIRRGVCQDFAHVMIAALRGIGVPAAYVSGFLRTSPPPGRARLEGADAMHAWVSAWCGKEAGWIDYDPTNSCFVGEDHIVVAVGRDYGDVTPIAGIMRMSGRQRIRQAVDVVPLD